MKKMLDKINIQKILIIYIIIQPIIDVITSLLVRNVSESLTLGIVVRSLFMVGIAIYALIISDKKYRIKMLCYYILLGIYVVTFLVISFLDNGTSGIVTQIKGIIKTFYLPVILVALIPIFKYKKVKIDNKIFVYSLLGYTAIMFLAKIAGVAYGTYFYGENEGTIGLFYAANEIGAIICSLSPILILSLMKFEEDKILNIVSLFLFIFSILEMGTKVPFLGTIGLACVTLLICLIRFFAIDRKEYLIKGIITVGVIIITVLWIPYTPIGKNIEINYGVSLPKIEIKKEVKAPSVENIVEKETKYNNVEELQTAVVSARNIYLKENIEKYKISDVENKFIGIGYVTEEEGETVPLKLIEMDYFDIALCEGILGTILYFIPFIILGVYIIKEMIKNIKKVIIDEDVWLMTYSIAICMAIALLAGHVLTAPAVGIFIAVILISLYYKLKELN